MAGIQMSGLVSGIDTASIIDQLMTIEKIPRTKITNDQAATTKKQSLLQDISTKLTSLRFANDDLKSALTWLDTQSVESADTSKFTVTRTGGAAPGGYDVSVNQLATAERQTYGFVSPTADGTLDIANADGTARVSVNVKAGADLDTVVGAINSNSKSGLYAVNVNGSLVLSSKTTGDSSGFAVSGAGVGDQTERVAGLNAKVTINGKTYERQTNTITDAMPGVTITLKGKTSGTDTVGLTVGSPGPDKDAIVSKVKAFITAYNDVVTATRADLTDARVVNASTSDDVQKGTLFGDSGLSTMLSQFRTTLSTALDGLAKPYQSMTDIGVTTGAASATLNQDSLDGKLTLDEDKLRAALDADPQSVRTLLGGTSGTNGFSQAFASILSNYQGSNGLIQARIASATTDLTDLKTKLTNFDARMDAKQALLQKQFTAMETALQSSNSAGSSLASYLNSSSS
ncbi:MAG TPA: flagellar filament capping protein FliD [Baekduia sp.]|uniref:flagellar filament capping protein FliD n=1 Tax=Baekduia sp. TaxID=2600305 RepID=UPI002D77A45B|nr:flagellar filament capping protein FliD [Baekduia sp.]HET6508852.1 flagellar filament capping protein FliD [Baekduia sp.]